MPKTETVAVTVALNDKKLTIEGPEDFVRQEVQRLTSLIASSSQVQQVEDASDGRSAGPASEKHLVEEKQPKGHHETVAVLAFALAAGGKTEFTEDDMKRAYIRAGVKPPKVVSQAIRDAKNNWDYIEPGSERGTYKLSHHGDRTVRFDLPRKEKVSK